MKAISIFLFIACLQSAHAADGTLYRCQGEKGASYSSKPVEGSRCTAVATYSKQEPPVTQPVQRAKWDVLALGEDSSLYFRPKDLKWNGNSVTFWVLIDHATDQKNSYAENYRSSVTRTSVNCLEKNYWDTQGTNFEGDMGSGKVVRTWTLRGKAEPVYASPYSVGETMIEKVCSARPRKGKA